MSMHQEFRLDALTREWVGVTGLRQRRPNLPALDACPFCVGGIEADSPYVVKAFPNRWPPMIPGTALAFARDIAIGSRLPARGAAEVILYSPDHDASFATLEPAHAAAVVDLWAERTATLLLRPEIEYVLVFENNGADVGATIPHPHGQIYAFPFQPPLPAREAAVAAHFGCGICADLNLRDDLEARIVARNHRFVTYTRYAAGWPFELLIAPGEHVADLAGLDRLARADFAQALADALTRYHYVFGEPLPYMFWIHPGVHLHLHLVTTRRQANTTRYVAAGELGSGTMFNPVLPEEAAALLRAAACSGSDEGTAESWLRSASPTRRAASRGAERAAVERLDLRVADGEFLVLVGPSGCGKTTSLRMLAVHERVDSGAISTSAAAT